MTPAGPAKVLIFPGLSGLFEPVQGPPRSILFKEKTDAAALPVVRIDGRSRADRQLASVLRRNWNYVSVLNAGEQVISVVVELAAGVTADPIIALARPTVEISGREMIFAKCRFRGIKVCDGFLEMLIKPVSYIFNRTEGEEHSLPAVWLVRLLIGDQPAISLYNRFHKIGKPLRLNSVAARQ